MINVYLNSVLVPLLQDNPQSSRLVKFANDKRIDIDFFDDKARFIVIGVRTIKVPLKCLKSFENLYNWVTNKVNKELAI